ncbi:MAG: LptF/LptG family permease [Vulcanimicrobiaceae bacterium]
MAVETLRIAPFASPRRRQRLPRILPILDSYILSELIGPFAFAFCAFLLFEFVNIFFLSADYIIGAHAPIFLVLRYLVFRIPLTTPLAFPFAALFASLLAFGRLAQDGELNALRTSGVRFIRIALTPLLCGLGIFVLSYAINEQLTPVTSDISSKAFYQIIYHTAQIPVIPQFFRKDDATGNVIYVGNVLPDHRTLEDVMIFQPAATTPFTRVLNAQKAWIDGDSLHLVKPRVSEFKPTGEFDGGHISSSAEIPLPAGENASEFLNSSSSDPFTIDTKQLAAQIKAMKATGEGGSVLTQDELLYAQKLAFPFSAFVAVLLALPLSAQLGRKGRNLGKAFGIALSVLLLFVYYLLMAAFSALGKNGALDPFVAAWVPNAIMGTAGLVLFRRVEH